MDQLTKDVQEVFGTKPRYAMYTGFGDDAVDAIVRSAKVLKMDWAQVYKELENLAKREDFAEATDTMVREMVYDKLGFTTDFYV